MLIGYAFVSAVGENLEFQREALGRAGVERHVVDVTSERPELGRTLPLLSKGDILVVWKLDRLGRSVTHLAETIEDLGHRGIGFRSLKENIDTTTAMGKLMFQGFRWLADFECGLTREQREPSTGRGKTQPQRRRRGPPPKLDETTQALAVTLYRDPGNSIHDICERLQIGRSTLHRYVSKDGGRKTARRPKAKTSQNLSMPRTD